MISKQINLSQDFRDDSVNLSVSYDDKQWLANANW